MWSADSPLQKSHSHDSNGVWSVVCHILFSVQSNGKLLLEQRGVETKPLRRRFLPGPITIEIRIHCRAALVQREMERRHFFANRWARASFLRPKISISHAARHEYQIPWVKNWDFFCSSARGAFLLSLGERRFIRASLIAAFRALQKVVLICVDRKRRRINNTARRRFYE